ncbi:MAG: aminoacyl-tRNA hydrolase [Ruminococcus sp.]|nr:aminoacyl-tRNA hydrolase [Ruminococcus sp.]
MSIWEAFDRISKKTDSNGKIEYIIAGLGNPGVAYENTRHNAGFITVGRLEEKLGFKANRHKFRSLCGEVTISGKRCLVIKPETFMNLSGEAVAQAADFYDIAPENIIVIFDDISLDPGRMRIRRKGSAGGHNGIKSIIASLGSDEFPRIKIGVGAKPHKDQDLADWVLSHFTDDEMKKVTECADNAVKALEYIVAGNVDKAMNEFNAG